MTEVRPATCVARSRHPSALAAFAAALLHSWLTTFKGSVARLATIVALAIAFSFPVFFAALLVIPVAGPNVIVGKPFVG